MTDVNQSSDVYGRYAGFYDALYRDKDYDAECDFLAEVLAKYQSSSVSSVLDLGSGTGGHDLPLARRGFNVVGVDRSAEMVRQAREKALEAGLDVGFELGNVCDLDLGRTFDAVISMFAVICYQVTNEDLLNMMRTARRHLGEGGLFVFDAWFGPAVLRQHPEERSKIIDLGDGESIERRATPVLDVMSHSVEVQYAITRRRGVEILDETYESHRMRYLFPQEIVHFLGLAGFEALAIGPFMDLDRVPGEDDWNISVVARAMDGVGA